MRRPRHLPVALTIAALLAACGPPASPDAPAGAARPTAPERDAPAATTVPPAPAAEEAVTYRLRLPGMT